MPTAKQVARRGRQQMRRLIRDGARKMIVGRLLSDNSVTVAGAPTGKLWVRSHPASREVTAVWTSKIYLPNAQVWVGPSLSGEDEIKGLVYAETAAQLGSKTLFAETPPIDGQINVLEVYGQNIVPGRLRAYAESGSMLVYVEPFAHEYGRFEGGTIDMTGHTPMSAGANQWVAVATDPKTNTLYAYDGPEDYNTAVNMAAADAFAIAIPSGYYPNGAVVLNAATTEVTPSNRFIDLRVHAGMRGQLELDDLANVNTAGKTDGDTLVWDAGTSEWIPGAGGGGSIIVTDGMTAVDPATELLFDASKFAVTDNGDGQAEVSLLGSVIPASGSKTRYVGTILHHETLGANGSFDVSSIPPDYENLELIIRARSTTSAADGIRIFFNNDTTLTNYRRSRMFTNGTTVSTTAADDGFIGLAVGASELADNYGEIRLFIPRYADTTQHKSLRATNDWRSAASTHETNVISVWWENTAAIDRIMVRTDNHSTDLLATGSTLTIIGWREETIGGLDTSTADVSNPPTDAELDSALGTPASVGAGYQCLLDDGGSDANVYLVVSNGTSWWYTALTKAT